MSRYPNIVLGGDPLAFPGRPNGYRRRRMFLAPGATSWTVPDDIPVGPDGHGRVRAVVIGGGAGCITGFSTSERRSGAGAGLALYDGIRVKPADVATISVGAAGANVTEPSASLRIGSPTTLALGGITLTANGGNGATGGTASGGQVNAQGAPGGTSMLDVKGGCSGSPWGNGEGEGWRNPFYPRSVSDLIEARITEYWDVEDVVINEAVYTGEWHDTVALLAPPSIGGAGPTQAGIGGGASFRTNAVESSVVFYAAGSGAAIIWF